MPHVSAHHGTSTSERTAPEVEPIHRAISVERILGFVIVWSPAGSDYLGAWLPVREGKWIFGRGPARAADAHPRLPLQCQRPGVNVPLPPLECAALSRTQIVFERKGPREIALARMGRCRVRVNGHDVDDAIVRDGDVIEI